MTQNIQSRKLQVQLDTVETDCASKLELAGLENRKLSRLVNKFKQERDSLIQALTEKGEKVLQLRSEL